MLMLVCEVLPVKRGKFLHKVLGRQSEFYSPIRGQPVALCQWMECHSSCYKSVNCKNDFLQFKDTLSLK